MRIVGDNKLPSRRDFGDRYKALATDLRHQITSGALKPGQMLDPETVIARDYHLSRASVRSILQELIQEGLACTIRGKGTVVIGQKGERIIIRLAMYMPAFEINQWQAAIDAFCSDNPEIEVQIVRISYSSYYETLQDMCATGNGPDLIAVNATGTQKLAQQMPLSNLEDELGGETQSAAMHPAVRNMFLQNGRLLAAPVFFSPIMLVYNKTLFAKAGMTCPDATWTWDTLINAAQTLSAQPLTTGIRFGFALSPAEHRWPIFLLQNGIKLGPAGLAVDHPQVVETISFVASLLHMSPPVPPASSGTGRYLSCEELFLQGHTAMTLTSYQAMNAFNDACFDWDITTPPHGKTQASLLLGVGLALNAASNQKAAALKLIRYLLQPKTQRIMNSCGTTLPSLREVCETVDSTCGGHPANYQAFQQVIDVAVPLKDGFPQLYRSALQEQVWEIWFNNLPVEAACRRAQANIISGLESDQQRLLLNPDVLDWIS